MQVSKVIFTLHHRDIAENRCAVYTFSPYVTAASSQMALAGTCAVPPYLALSLITILVHSSHAEADKF